MFSLKKIKRQKNYLKTILESSTPKSKKFQSNFDTVIVIGRAKTGTSSVKMFLKSYGSKHLTINRWVTKKHLQKNYDFLLGLISKYNSFDDKPWNRLDVIQKVMELKLNIGFIYTYRDPNIRFDSMVRYAKKLDKKVPTEDMRENTIKSDKHHKDCVQYLSKKFCKKVLYIDVTTNQDKAKIIHDFLGFDITVKEFPHSNKTIVKD